MCGNDVWAVAPSRSSRAAGLYGAKGATEPPFRRLGPSGNDPYRAARCTVTASSLISNSAASAQGLKASRSPIASGWAPAIMPRKLHPDPIPACHPTPCCWSLMLTGRPLPPPMLLRACGRRRLRGNPPAAGPPLRSGPRRDAERRLGCLRLQPATISRAPAGE
jgi:hypothetical protein